MDEKESNLMKSANKTDRGARRKARTRARLLEASEQLFIAKGLERVSIQDITDTADVGFGTFYASKRKAR